MFWEEDGVYQQKSHAYNWTLDVYEGDMRSKSLGPKEGTEFRKLQIR